MRYRWLGALLSLLCAAAMLSLGFVARSQVIMAEIGTSCTVVIDAGHGGFDPGAVGSNGSGEANINLAIAKLIQARLEGLGYRVVMTRETEDALGKTKREDMQKRREIIAQSGADYTVSIHLNANPDRSCYGPVVLYHPDSVEGKRLAEHLQSALNKGLSIAKPRAVQTGSYFILNSGQMPSVIVECGFITNQNDAALLVDATYQQKLAEIIAAGMDEFITIQRQLATPSPQGTPTP